MSARPVERTDSFSYFWTDPDEYTFGAGFRYQEEGTNYKVDTNALGSSLRWGPLGPAASVEVARLNVSSSTADGRLKGSVSAQALTASAKLGAVGELGERLVNENGKVSSSGPKVWGAGVEAHIAKTSVSGGIKIGPVSVELTGRVGYGASAGIGIGKGEKRFGFQAHAGLGPTVGLGLTVSWDTAAAETAIAKATAPRTSARSAEASAASSPLMCYLPDADPPESTAPETASFTLTRPGTAKHGPTLSRD